MLTTRFNPNAPALPEPAAATMGAPAPIKKVSLAGFATKKPSGAESEYPIFPDPNGKAAETAALILKMQQQFEALEGSLKSNKKFLVDLTAPFHFKNSHGKPEPAKAVVVDAALLKADGTLDREDDGSLKLCGRVRVDFKEKYPLLEDESSLGPILGEHVGDFFRQKFTLSIDGDKLPENKVEELLGKLQSLFADFNASDALTVKSGFAPNDTFHVKRHSAFTPEQNLSLQRVCPIQAAVATKNVK